MLAALARDPVADADGDDRLMWRLRAHDEAALAALYDRHAGAAYGLALRMPRDPPAAEEVVQDAFLALWRHAAAFQAERTSLRSWLLTIARNRAVDRLRRQRSRGPAVAQGVRAAAVRGAVTALLPAQRQVLEWAHVAGLSQSEIANRTGLALGTVKSRTRLALDHLRRVLAGTDAAEATES